MPAWLYFSDLNRAVLRVSKGWDRFLSSMRDLWMRIDFSGARGKIHWSSALAYIRRSKAMLTEAIVANLTKASIRKVLEYISRCPNLQHLQILSPSSPNDIYELFKGCKKLKTLLVSSDTTIPQSTLTKLLASFPKLERIEIHNATKSRAPDVHWPPALPNLQSITLGTTESGVHENYIPALYIPRLIDPTTPLPISNLTELRLHSNPKIFVPYPPSFNPADLPRLQKLDISGLYIGGTFGLPPTLQFLRIRGGAAIEALPFATPTTDESNGQLQPLHLPNLTTLIFSDVPWVTHLTLMAFVANAGAPLEVLHVDSCFRVPAAILVSILREHGAHLNTLNLAHVMGVQDSTVAVLVGGVRSLNVLNLAYTDITGVTIKALADSQMAEDTANVECLYVKGCEGISSDAIDYGRSKGLVIVT
jgi:F-box/TPR repeat protein Pof3